jgi:hypothetical protein
MPLILMVLQKEQRSQPIVTIFAYLYAVCRYSVDGIAA